VDHVMWLRKIIMEQKKNIVLLDLRISTYSIK